MSLGKAEPQLSVFSGDPQVYCSDGKRGVPNDFGGMESRPYHSVI